MTSQDDEIFIEKLLGNHCFYKFKSDLNKYQRNIEQDPDWSLFPLRTSFIEELENDTSKQDSQNSFLKDIDKITGNIGQLKKSRNQLRMRKLASDAQLTDGWFGLKQVEATEEAKNNYLIMQLKKYIDPKNPSKSSDFTKMPKFFQMGTVLEGGDEYGGGNKISRGKKQSSLIDQFLEQDRAVQFSRKKFGELQKKGQKIFKFNKKYGKKRNNGDQN